MLVKLNDNVVINVKQVISLVLYTCKPIPAVYKGIFFKKQITPEKPQWEVTLTYVCPIYNAEKTLTWAYDDYNIAKAEVKVYNEVIMSLDQKYIDKAFENEILS